MKNYLKTGVSFGLTSSTIVTLGLMMGLYASTSSKSAVFSGILLIALSDAFSDSLGVHVSEESKKSTTKKHVWLATLSTLLTKIFYTLTFAIPFIFFSIKTSIIISSIWGILILGILSFVIARINKQSVTHTVLEHLGLAGLVLFLSNIVGHWINKFFG